MITRPPFRVAGSHHFPGPVTRTMAAGSRGPLEALAANSGRARTLKGRPAEDAATATLAHGAHHGAQAGDGASWQLSPQAAC